MATAATTGATKAKDTKEEVKKKPTTPAPTPAEALTEVQKQLDAATEEMCVWKKGIADVTAERDAARTDLKAAKDICKKQSEARKAAEKVAEEMRLQKVAAEMTADAKAAAAEATETAAKENDEAVAGLTWELAAAKKAADAAKKDRDTARAALAEKERAHQNELELAASVSRAKAESAAAGTDEADVGAAAAELETAKQAQAQLQAQVESLTSAGAVKDGAVATLEKEVAVLTTAVRDESVPSAAAADELAASRTQVTGLEENVQVLSGKVRELMKKAKDFKDRATALEEVSAQHKAEAEAKASELEVFRGGADKQTSALEKLQTKLQATLQSKESELVRLRLKNDALDKAALDCKAETAQLSGRYMALQAELSELQASLTAREAADKTTGSAREAATALYEGLKVDLAASEAALVGERCRAEALEKTLATERAAAAASVSQGVAASEERCQALVKEVESLKASITTTSVTMAALEAYKAGSEAKLRESAGALEAYKKKAQVALKRATADSQGMGKEAVGLRAACKEKEDRLAEAEAATAAVEEAKSVLATAKQGLETSVSELRAQVGQLQREAGEATTAADARVEASSSEVGALHEQLQDHASALAAANAARNEAERQLESTKSMSHGSVGRSPAAKSRRRQQPPPPSPAAAPESQLSDTATDADAVEHADATPFATEATNGVEPYPTRRATSPSPSPLTPATGLDFLPGGAGQGDPDGLAHAPVTRNVYFAQLQEQLALAKQTLGQRDADLETLTDDLHAQAAETKALQERIDELVAYIDRHKKQQSESESHMSNEYLKNVVFHFMSATTSADQMRLLPVIATILKFTDKETRTVSGAIDSAVIAAAGVAAGQGLAGFAASFLG